MWQSMSGTRGVPWLTLGVAGVAVLVVAAAAGGRAAGAQGLHLAGLPVVVGRLLARSTRPNNLTDGSASLPAHAASPTGRTGVGGFLGFAKSLDTGVRASLGNQVVMRVRASRPSFWVGQTYDTWNGQSWVESAIRPAARASSSWTGGSPFDIPPEPATSRRIESVGPRPTSRPSTWPSRGPTWCSTPTTPSGSTSSPAPCS